MRLAASTRRALAAGTSVLLLAGGLQLFAGPAQAVELRRTGESPAAGSLVKAPALIAATYTNFLSPSSSIAAKQPALPTLLLAHSKRRRNAAHQ